MSAEIDVLKVVASRLDGAGIAYMVTGSIALSVYVEPRMTRDIDVVAELVSGDAPRILDLFGAEFYCPSGLIAEAIARRSMFNLIHDELAVKVDFVVCKDEPFRRHELARRRRIQLAGVLVAFASPEDLVLSKLAWSRGRDSPLQGGDVRRLLAAPIELDLAYLERWARDLGVEPALRQALVDSGRGDA